MFMPRLPFEKSLRIAVVGSGISGLAAAWLLSTRHSVTVFEAGSRLGGHSRTIDWNGQPVDTGFIVYNEEAYPNLTAMFRHLKVPTKASDMSFAASLDDGRLEYSGSNPLALFGQRRNLFRPRFWSMLWEIMRFFRHAPRDRASLGGVTLDEYLSKAGYGAALKEDFLYPMAAAIWSTPAAEVGAYPAESFIRFFQNHGLLKAVGQPRWRTVEGGAEVYVREMARALTDVRLNTPIRSIIRDGEGVELVDASGRSERFDHVVIGAHADQAMKMLADPSVAETEALGAFRYGLNRAVMHTDASAMPKRRAVWSSWNYASAAVDGSRSLSVTYWMNKLQGIDKAKPVFVTLNPIRDIPAEHVINDEMFEHPLFDSSAVTAQRKLMRMQGDRHTWFCGAYFGWGFHEDGLQAGLAVAEALGGCRRPWNVEGESDRLRSVQESPEWATA